VPTEVMKVVHHGEATNDPPTPGFGVAGE
jgi:hypothetical protein